MEFEIIQIILLGPIVGFLSSFFGIGGGSLIVPVLYGLYPKITPSIVIPISLGSIFFIVSLNIFRFSKQKLLPPKDIIINFAIFCGIGSWSGSQIVHLINAQMARFSMGIILILMIFKIFFFKNKPMPNKDKNRVPDSLTFAMVGFVGAFISSITGLGGGLIFTPFFMSILKVPTAKVSPYSNLAMLITTFIGVLPHFFNSTQKLMIFKTPWLNHTFIGDVNYFLVGAIVIPAMFSAQLGVKLNRKVEDKNKKLLLSILLSIFAGKLLLGG